MSRLSRAARSLIFVSAPLCLSCEPPSPQGSGAPDAVEGEAPARRFLSVEDEKSDNYISTTAREYEISGEDRLPLPEALKGRDPATISRELSTMIYSAKSSVLYAIQAEVRRLAREANGGSLNKEDSFFVYFKRSHTQTGPTEYDIVDDQLVYTFELELVGSMYLMSAVAPQPNRGLKVQVSDWRTQTTREVEAKIKGSESRDAFPMYDKLFEDGVLDIRIQFGGDYNEERLDLETARWTIDYLLEAGWSHPTVKALEDIKLDSEPFTRTITVAGAPLEVRVYLSHQELASEESGGSLADLRRFTEAALAEADVYLYSGHAGPGSGLVLSYGPRYEIPARELASLPVRDGYQIIILDGCETYRTYVDDLLKAPERSLEQTDIITAVNTTPFSVGYQLIAQTLHWLTISDERGQHYPLSWASFLRGVNTDQFWDVHYGVHGIDADPELNPFGGIEQLCVPCETDQDCPGGGNLCLTYPQDGGGFCGVACTTDRACGAEARCARLLDIEDYFYISKQCVPRSDRCAR